MIINCISDFEHSLSLNESSHSLLIGLFHCFTCLRMMNWAEHVASSGDTRNGFVTEFYLGLQKGRNYLGELGLEKRIEDMDCIHLVQDRGQ